MEKKEAEEGEEEGAEEGAAEGDAAEGDAAAADASTDDSSDAAAADDSADDSADASADDSADAAADASDADASADDASADESKDDSADAAADDSKEEDEKKDDEKTEAAQIKGHNLSQVYSESSKKKKHLAQTHNPRDQVNKEVMNLTLEDVNWLYEFFTTADADHDFQVLTEDLINNVSAGPDQKDKLRYFFAYMDADNSGTIDFSEWLNWGAQDGTRLLNRIREEKGISEEQLRDPGAQMPCGEERLKMIETSMR